MADIFSEGISAGHKISHDYSGRGKFGNILCLKTKTKNKLSPEERLFKSPNLCSLKHLIIPKRTLLIGGILKGKIIDVWFIRVYGARPTSWVL